MEEKKLTDEELNDLISRIEYESWAQNSIELSKAAYMLKYQKAEIERLTKERDGYLDDRFAVCHALREMKKENAELQKKVDELKEQKAFWEGMHDRVCSELEELKEAKSNTDLVTQIYVLKNKLEQAVKDTAKEIYELIDAVKEIFPNDICGYEMAHGWSMCVDKLKEIVKSKGVEVE